MNITSELWGYAWGEAVYRYRLSGDRFSLVVSSLGASVCSIGMPDRAGHVQNVVLGYHTLEGYRDDPYYAGATVGRYAGRIAGAAFRINGVDFHLATNGGPGIHLHGGVRGLNKRVFSPCDDRADRTLATVQFRYLSPHGEEGYPGNLDLRVRYSLFPDQSVTIQFEAVSDADTHLNLTNHTYFNLGGTRQSILDHELTLGADIYYPTRQGFIPTGETVPVTGTAFDFQSGSVIVPHLNECFLLSSPLAACLRHPRSGRTVSVETSLPALLVYTGDYLGGPFSPNQGICLEAQFPPDAPNHASFPSTLLKAGQPWKHQITWKFGSEG